MLLQVGTQLKALADHTQLRCLDTWTHVQNVQTDIIAHFQQTEMAITNSAAMFSCLFQGQV